jgi:PleD family two-component response regulator
MLSIRAPASMATGGVGRHGWRSGNRLGCTRPPPALKPMEPVPVQALNAHELRPRSTRALIVDDNLELRELLGGYLTRFNIASEAVGDGTGMRRALAQSHFDVIILDLMLPGEDGLALCRELRSASDIRS